LAIIDAEVMNEERKEQLENRRRLLLQLLLNFQLTTIR
jgi:hypothetical protein